MSDFLILIDDGEHTRVVPVRNVDPMRANLIAAGYGRNGARTFLVAGQEITYTAPPPRGPMTPPGQLPPLPTEPAAPHLFAEQANAARRERWALLKALCGRVVRWQTGACDGSGYGARRH